ncbi:hypothetical protein AHAS_Ahas06G0146600 [Arachis hypogaea]
MAHMVQKLVGMVGKNHGHMEVFVENRLVSVVEGHVEDMDHRHMVVVLENHKEIHHSHLIGMHHRMALLHSALVGVVAMRIDHMHMAPPTFDYPILDTQLHYSSHHLQHNCNYTHSQSENS